MSHETPWHAVRIDWYLNPRLLAARMHAADSMLLYAAGLAHAASYNHAGTLSPADVTMLRVVVPDATRCQEALVAHGLWESIAGGWRVSDAQHRGTRSFKAVNSWYVSIALHAARMDAADSMLLYVIGLAVSAVPRGTPGSLGAIDVSMAAEPLGIDLARCQEALVAHGLWEQIDGGWRITDTEQAETMVADQADRVSKRQKATERKRRYRERNKAAGGTPAQDTTLAGSAPSRRHLTVVPASADRDIKARESDPDVQAVIDAMLALARQTSEVKNKESVRAGRDWPAYARKILDGYGEDLETVLAVIRWIPTYENAGFSWTHVQSMRTLHTKWGDILGDWKRDQKRRARVVSRQRGVEAQSAGLAAHGAAIAAMSEPAF